jgi:hypothetical protein
MVVNIVVDDSLWDQGGHYDCRDTWAIPVEAEVVCAATTISWRRRGRRRNVIIEPAVFIPRDDQQTPLPVRRIADDFVYVLD